MSVDLKNLPIPKLSKSYSFISDAIALVSDALFTSVSSFSENSRMLDTVVSQFLHGEIVPIANVDIDNSTERYSGFSKRIMGLWDVNLEGLQEINISQYSQEQQQTIGTVAFAQFLYLVKYGELPSAPHRVKRDTYTHRSHSLPLVQRAHHFAETSGFNDDAS